MAAQAYYPGYYGNTSYPPSSGAATAPATSAPPSGHQYNQAYNPGYSQADYNYYNYYYGYYNYPNAQSQPQQRPPPPPPSLPPPPPPPSLPPPPPPPTTDPPQTDTPKYNTTSQLQQNVTNSFMPEVTSTAKQGPRKMNMMTPKKHPAVNNNVKITPTASPSTASVPANDLSASDISLDNYPPSLSEYVTEVFKVCPREYRDQAEKEMRAIILKYKHSLSTTKWEEMEYPSVCPPRFTSKKKKNTKKVILSPVELKKLEMRRKRFMNSEPSTPATPITLPSSAMEGVELNKVVVGTSTDLEKPYFRNASALDPSTIRPLPVLKETLNLLKRKWKENKKYSYICEQFKSMRQDLTLQQIRNTFTVKVYELHARIALEEDDLGEYNQCQTQLKELYKHGIAGNVSEFTAYRILYFLHTQAWDDINSVMGELTTELKGTEEVKHALQVRSSLATSNYHWFFKLYLTAPKMSAYLMDKFVERERIKALMILCKAFRPGPSFDYIEKELAFENRENLKDFLLKHRLPCLENSLDAKASFKILQEVIRKVQKVDIKGQKM